MMRLNSLLLIGCVSLLSACGGSDKKDHYDFSQIAGTYQLTQDDPTLGPMQTTVYLVDRDTSLLVVRDTRDQVTSVMGTLNESTGLVSFSDGSSCSDKAVGLSCSLKGVATDIPAMSTSAVSLPNLAGSYQVSSDNQIYQIAIANDGKITSSVPCSLSGQLNQNQSLGVNTIQLRDCTGKNLFGVLTQEKIDTNMSALEVYLPNSTLGGFWVRP